MGTRLAATTEPGHLRTFIACALPETVRAHLAKVQACLREAPLALRWVKTGNIHLTLKFIGETPVDILERLLAAMHQVAAGRQIIRLQTKGLGVFPNLKRPRVVWVGLEGDLEALAALHADLDEALDPKILPRVTRPFHGHLTLGRARERLPVGVLAEALQHCADNNSPPFTVDRVTLYQSDLRPGGAVYTLLGEAGFG